MNEAVTLANIEVVSAPNVGGVKADPFHIHALQEVVSLPHLINALDNLLNGKLPPQVAQFFGGTGNYHEFAAIDHDIAANPFAPNSTIALGAVKEKKNGL